MSKDKVKEVIFNCLGGPTHHFGGLSHGNISSTKNKHRHSQPRKAALEGLKMMRFLMDKGFAQCILPPHPRPHWPSFKRLGFSGTPAQTLQQAYTLAPELFLSLCSSSFMWAANSATYCPKSDALDKQSHLTPANLVSMFHRSIEPAFAHRVFKKIFAHVEDLVVHDPLPAHDLFSDEGAANHNRMAMSHEDKGLHIFVFGKKDAMLKQETKIYPARQSSLANLALARLHQIDPQHYINVQQNPLAIDHGVFHNDVVCVCNESLMLVHEQAFMDQAHVLDEITNNFSELHDIKPFILEIKKDDLSLNEAVSSYIFNAQILTKNDGKMLLFAPNECLELDAAQSVIKNIINSANPIDEVAYFSVSESMANGGGPACLRLRLVLSAEQIKSLHPGIFLTEELHQKLKTIIEKYYIEDLSIENFFDQHFIDSTNAALEAVSDALDLKGIYDI